MKSYNILMIVVVCRFFPSAESRRMTCPCDIQDVVHVSSSVYAADCMTGNRFCLSYCLRAARAIFIDKNKLSYICKTKYETAISAPYGRKLIVRYGVTDCGIQYTYDLRKNLCCKESNPKPNGSVFYDGYIC